MPTNAVSQFLQSLQTPNNPTLFRGLGNNISVAHYLKTQSRACRFRGLKRIITNPTIMFSSSSLGEEKKQHNRAQSRTACLLESMTQLQLQYSIGWREACGQCFKAWHMWQENNSANMWLENVLNRTCTILDFSLWITWTWFINCSDQT